MTLRRPPPECRLPFHVLPLLESVPRSRSGSPVHLLGILTGPPGRGPLSCTPQRKVPGPEAGITAAGFRAGVIDDRRRSPRDLRLQLYYGMEKHRFPSNVVYREESEGGIVFNVDTGDMRFVEGVARGICWLIDRGRTRQEILAELIARYPEIPASRLEQDLDAFVADLRNCSMLIGE